MTRTPMHQAIRDLDLTQSELGALFGVTGNTVARWCAGTLRMSPMAETLWWLVQRDPRVVEMLKEKLAEGRVANRV